MSDLTGKLGAFFQSPCKTFKEFEQTLITESVTSKNTAEAWSNAVQSWRLGMKKLHSNDLTGVEDLKKANEALKAVVSGNKKEEELKTLNESIESLKSDNLEEELEALEHQVGSLYEKLKEDGFESDEELELELGGEEVEEEVPESDLLEVVDVKPEFKEEEPLEDVPVIKKDEPVDADDLDPIDQLKEVTKDVPGPQKPKSGYEDGFLAGRKRWKKGENSKALVKTIAESELREETYSYVNRYMEGFAAGFAFEEQVKRDLEPELFAEEEKSA
jgi:hypothetical protein